MPRTLPCGVTSGLTLSRVFSTKAGLRRHLLIKVYQCLSQPMLSPYYGDIHHPSSLNNHELDNRYYPHFMGDVEVICPWHPETRW